MYIDEDQTASPCPVLCGRSLARRRLSAHQRAALAAQVFKGEVAIEPSVSQLAKLFGVPVRYINAARKLPQHQREMLATGNICIPLLLEPEKRRRPSFRELWERSHPNANGFNNPFTHEAGIEVAPVREFCGTHPDNETPKKPSFREAWERSHPQYVVVRESEADEAL